MEMRDQDRLGSLDEEKPMINPSKLEESYKKYTEDLAKWAPDGIVKIDLSFLQSLDLLHCSDLEMEDAEQELTQMFNIIESPDKITLYNNEFVIWIVPDLVENVPVTFALIAQLHTEELQLEMVLSIGGPYNTPRLVLKILQKLLQDIQDNDKAINRLK